MFGTEYQFQSKRAVTTISNLYDQVLTTPDRPPEASVYTAAHYRSSTNQASLMLTFGACRGSQERLNLKQQVDTNSAPELTFHIT